MENNNGFADMADYLGKLSQVDATKLSFEQNKDQIEKIMTQQILDLWKG